MTLQETPPAGPAELSAAKRALLQARLWGLHRADAIPRRPDGAPAPLTFDQERLWFLDRLGQGGPAYDIFTGLRLRGALDVAALERALGEVVRRHEALRTTLREVDGAAEQVVAPFAGFSLPVDDLSPLPAAERQAALSARVDDVARHRFDLGRGPLFTARLVRLAADDHALLLCVHHVVSDGGSVRVIDRETWALYDAFSRGLPSPLSEPPVQYGDWAVWQRSRSRRDAEARHLEYWVRQLEGAPELLELPTDHPRPPVPSLRGGRVPVRVAAPVLERLREVARAEGATLFMVVLAGFKALLARYGAGDDVVVGTPIDGRTRREVEEVVGLFMNTLVLRTPLSGDPTFRQLVGRVRETVLGAWEHQDVPFERVIAELRPERSLSHSTLFQVLFQLDEAGDDGAGGGALRIDEIDREGDTTKLDLSLLLHAHGGGITGGLHFAADLFERGSAARMAERLDRLLEHAAAHPDQRVSRLNLLAPDERERLLAWNRTEAEYPAGRCIHQLFAEQAARTPDSAAIEDLGAALTYRELDERANRLARHLARLGVHAEVRVGICMERSLELMVAILGVMKAGGAYVPVDPSHPAERIAYTFADSGARVILTQERLRDRLPSSGVEVISLDTAWAEIESESADAPESDVSSENLAYVIYTSGSTGRPKGVAMHHRGVCNYIDWGIRFYGAGEGNGAPVFSSMAVDLTITNLLPLFAGKTVRLLPEDSPVESLADALRERPGFGLIKITPIHLGLLNTLLSPGELAGAARTLVIGADFLSAEPTVPWQEHAPDVRLMNEYGPTETVVGCSAYLLPRGRHRAGPVPVGPPIQNLTFHVLDARLHAVPVALPGELYIGGAGVARGYLGRPGLTAEKFVPDPFAGAGARMYRTGDRARWLEDGNLMILGRTDNQVKVRGYRVELGEVEAALRGRPGVRDCIAAVREDRPGDRRLVAYVVADLAETGGAALRDHLRGTLPGYMVPDAVVVLHAFPRTVTGKLDRKALPAPEWSAAGDELDEPRSFLEARLIQLWEEILGVEQVSPSRSFFELGGSSFLALRLVAAVNRRIGCELPLATLFSGGTVRHMAEAIEAEARTAPAPASPVVALQPNGALPPLFCVHSADREVFGYVGLVRRLGAEQPVYGVRDLGEDLARPLAEIAAGHVRALRAAHPRGPYYLLGWSFGGFVTYEMAIQLEREGAEVAFLGMLDTMSPELVQRWPWVADADLVLGEARDIASHTRRPFALERGELEGLGFDAQVRVAVQALHAQGAAPPELDEAAFSAGCAMMRDRIRSRTGYVPGAFPRTLTLFRAESVSADYVRFFEPCTDQEKRTLGWCRHAAEVEVRTVPGQHTTLASEPHVRVLAREMTEALALARARASSSLSTEGDG